MGMRWRALAAGLCACGLAITSARPAAAAEAGAGGETDALARSRGAGEEVYGRAGTVELGGRAALTVASDFLEATLAPSVGWFVVDRLELSATLLYGHVRSGGVGSSRLAALAEPSVHVSLGARVYAFAGVGAGVAWIEDVGAGLAVAPRAGLNVRVGRSGVLSPELRLDYVSHGAVATSGGALLAVSLTYGLALGYSVLW